MRKCEITNKTANFGKTRSHRKGSAGGTEGAWSKKATAKPKRQNVNLRKIRVIDNTGRAQRIYVSMKALKKAKQNEGRLNEIYTLANFHIANNK